MRSENDHGNLSYETDDKHPRLTTAGSLWISVWLWLATAWLWAVAWAAAQLICGLVWTTNAVKNGLIIQKNKILMKKIELLIIEMNKEKSKNGKIKH